jgi:HTH-type transcriptional regulator/antitoxin HigA
VTADANEYITHFYDMIDKIITEAQYNHVMASIEKFIAKATDGADFNSLSVPEQEELNNLSLLAGQYENNVLQLMPL